MPIPAPPLDDRRYADLVAELLARVPVHTPEWTNLGPSDPGVTLVQLFAHLAESLLYRTNQIPERNRRRFLDLLGIGLQPARPSEGLAVIENERGPLKAGVLKADLELTAGAIPFRTLDAVDALPVQARPYIKRPVAEPAPETKSYYALLYAAYDLPAPDPDKLDLYETIAWDWTLGPIDLETTSDRSIWFAILAREQDAANGGEDPLRAVRNDLGGRILSLGLAPTAELEARVLGLGEAADTTPIELLRFELPQVNGPLPTAEPERRPVPQYRALEARASFDTLGVPGVFELPLPSAAGLDTWRDLDPLEAGVGDLPPAVEDPALTARLITWLRVRAVGSAAARFRWAGINAVRVRQQTLVRAEPLPLGDGSPNQVRKLGRAPVLRDSVSVLTVEGNRERSWRRIDDLLAADPEVLVAGVPVRDRRETDVFELDAESGRLIFGDGLAGRRLALNARVYASYAYCEGAAGNVAANAIAGGPLLPAGYSTYNPLPTGGGADAEDVSDGERQVRRHLQHRDRLVTVDDFTSIAWRAPGIEIGRIEVIPAWRPELAPAGAGSAPGAVTLMAIPRRDPAHPAAPRPDRTFLDMLCRHLDPRRLVTTELIVRGPIWKGIWISVGVEVAAGRSTTETLEAVRAGLSAALSPLPPAGVGAADLLAQPFGPRPDPALSGWPLGQAVRSIVLAAEAARVVGVHAVVDVLLAEAGRGAVVEVPMDGIELPEILGISVVVGEPVPIDVLRGTRSPGDVPVARPRLPVPIIPETC